MKAAKTQQPPALNLEAVEMFLSQLREHEEQMHALAISLLARLTPKDENDPEEEYDITSYRLAQMLEDMLGASDMLERARDLLPPEGQQGVVHHG